MTKIKTYPIICAVLLIIGCFRALLSRRTGKEAVSLSDLDCPVLNDAVFKAWHKKFPVIFASFFIQNFREQVRRTTSGDARNVFVLYAGDLGARAKPAGERSLMTGGRNKRILFVE